MTKSLWNFVSLSVAVCRAVCQCIWPLRARVSVEFVLWVMIILTVFFALSVFQLSFCLPLLKVAPPHCCGFESPVTKLGRII